MKQKDLEGKSVTEILKLINEEYGDKLFMTTGFGYSGIVLMHFIKDVIPKLPIYFFDTGFHFKETLELADRIEKEWGLKIIHMKPKKGLKIDYRNPTDCCYHRKVEPLLSILKEDLVWLTALRKDQSKSRKKTEILEVDSRGTLKINPLYNWSKRDCWEYIKKHKLPYNPLIDKGFPSVGCEPCTTPVKNNEDERSGRWRGTKRAGGECGLHE